ncbi:MAG: head GIN domain-containing protein [Limisphaerales bacterium]
MKTAFLPFLCLGLVTVGDCNPNAIHGSGNIKTEARNVGSFTKINLSGSPDIAVTIGPELSVAVTTDDNILPVINTTVDGATLNVYSKQSYHSTQEVKVEITMPALDGVSVSGSGDIQVAGLKAGELEARVTGSGNVTLKGSAERLRAEVTGSGDVHAGDLSAKRARVNVTGSGDVTVRASAELEATVTGSGDVNYYGNPPQVNKHVTGSGEINAH